MIEVIHRNLLISFFIRIGTTTTGLLVSTVVSMFVLPPNYSNTILTSIHSLLKATGEELETISEKIIVSKTGDQSKELAINETFSKLKKKLDNTEMLLRFQKGESKYHRFGKEAKKVFDEEQNKLSALRLIHYHIGNLINTPLDDVSWSEQECNQLKATVNTLADTMKHPDHFRIKKHRAQVRELME